MQGHWDSFVAEAAEKSAHQTHMNWATKWQKDLGAETFDAISGQRLKPFDPSADGKVLQEIQAALSRGEQVPGVKILRAGEDPLSLFPNLAGKSEEQVLKVLRDSGVQLGPEATIKDVHKWLGVKVKDTEQVLMNIADQSTFKSMSHLPMSIKQGNIETARYAQESMLKLFESNAGRSPKNVGELSSFMTNMAEKNPKELQDFLVKSSTELHEQWLARPGNSYAFKGEMDVPFRELSATQARKDMAPIIDEVENMIGRTKPVSGAAKESLDVTKIIKEVDYQGPNLGEALSLLLSVCAYMCLCLFLFSILYYSSIKVV